MPTFRTGAGVFCIQELGEGGGTGHAEDVANSISGVTYGPPMEYPCDIPYDLAFGYMTSDTTSPTYGIIFGANQNVTVPVTHQTLTLGVDTVKTLTLTMEGIF